MIRMPEPRSEEATRVAYARADIERLADAIEDLEARATHAATRDEGLLPEAVVRRLVAGESPVRVLREHRGIKAATLAAAAGVSASCLSEIETGRKPGSATALRDLARVLEVAVDDLIP